MKFVLAALSLSLGFACKIVFESVLCVYMCDPDETQVQTCLCVCSYRQLGLDLVPRREFSMVDPDDISVTELYKLVRSSSGNHIATATASFTASGLQNVFSEHK